MDLYRLEYIIAIAEEGSVSKAADRLFISQSALSQNLLNLEAKLGVKLFKRINRRLVLSCAGESYLHAAYEILEIKKKLYKMLGDISDSDKGRFSLGLTLGRGIEKFSTIYAKFHREYPDIKIDVLENNSVMLEQAVKQGKVDLATISAKHFDDEINYEHLYNDELMLLLKHDHRHADLGYTISRKRFSGKDMALFKDDDFIITTKATTLRTVTDQIFAEAGFTPNIILETSSSAAIGKLVQAGMGIAFSPQSYTTSVHDLAKIYLEAEYNRDMYVAYRKDNYISRPERYLIKLLKEGEHTPM